MYYLFILLFYEFLFLSHLRHWDSLFIFILSLNKVLVGWGDCFGENFRVVSARIDAEFQLEVWGISARSSLLVNRVQKGCAAPSKYTSPKISIANV